jgi:hypothetical protein
MLADLVRAGLASVMSERKRAGGRVVLLPRADHGRWPACARRMSA